MRIRLRAAVAVGRSSAQADGFDPVERGLAQGLTGSSIFLDGLGDLPENLVGDGGDGGIPRPSASMARTNVIRVLPVMVARASCERPGPASAASTATAPLRGVDRWRG